MKTSITIVAKRMYSEVGKRGLTLLLGLVMTLLLASLVLPSTAFSQSPREAGVIPASHSTIYSSEMIPLGIVSHKIHVNIPIADLRSTSQVRKFVTLSADPRPRHHRHHRRHGSSAASSSAAAGGGEGGSAASSSAAAGGGEGGSAASSSAAAGG